MEYKTWGALLEDWQYEVILLTTATTGLKPDSDELIGVWYAKMRPDPTAEIVAQDMLIRRVPESALANGSEYHKVTPEFVRIHGCSDDEFYAKLEPLKEYPIFSYNPQFQAAFTGLYVLDLLKLKAIADTHMAVPGDKSIREILSESPLKPKSARHAFQNVRVSDETFKSFRTPAEASLYGLTEIWKTLCKTEVAVESAPQTGSYQQTQM